MEDQMEVAQKIAQFINEGESEEWKAKAVESGDSRGPCVELTTDQSEWTLFLDWFCEIPTRGETRGWPGGTPRKP